MASSASEIPKKLLLGRHLRVEHGLQNEIAEFLRQLAPLAAVYGVKHFVSFFERIRFDGIEGLLAIPGAAAGRAQARHQRNQFLEFLAGGFGGMGKSARFNLSWAYRGVSPRRRGVAENSAEKSGVIWFSSEVPDLAHGARSHRQRPDDLFAKPPRLRVSAVKPPATRCSPSRCRASRNRPARAPRGSSSPIPAKAGRWECR